MIDSSVSDAPTRPTPGTEPAAVTITLELATLDAVERWAESAELSRADALARLVELGLESAPGARPLAVCPDRAIELAASQIGALIDPEAPPHERDRRIARLTEGPPEFVEARVDRPRRRATDYPQQRSTDRSAPQD
jgi:hypothetical protein